MIKCHYCVLIIMYLSLSCIIVGLEYHHYEVIYDM